MVYQIVKNIMIASAAATFYHMGIANVPERTAWIGTICIFWAVLMLMRDADKEFMGRRK